MRDSKNLIEKCPSKVFPKKKETCWKPGKFTPSELQLFLLAYDINDFLYYCVYSLAPPRRGKMAHSHEKVGGCSRASCSFTCLMVDHVTAQIKVVRKSLFKIQRYNCIYTTISLYLGLYL